MSPYRSPDPDPPVPAPWASSEDEEPFRFGVALLVVPSFAAATAK